MTKNFAHDSIENSENFTCVDTFEILIEIGREVNISLLQIDYNSIITGNILNSGQDLKEQVNSISYH